MDKKNNEVKRQMFPSLTREKVMISANIQLMKNKLHPFNDYEVSYVARENCARHV